MAATQTPRQGRHGRQDTLTKFMYLAENFDKNAPKRSNSALLNEDMLALLDAPEEKSSGRGGGRSHQRPAKSIWACSVCTFHNNTHLRYCEICGVMRDANVEDEQILASPIGSPEASPNPPRWDETNGDLTAAIADHNDMLELIHRNNKSRAEQPVSRRAQISPSHTLVSPNIHHRSESTPAVPNYIPISKRQPPPVVVPSGPRPPHHEHRRSGSIPNPLEDDDLFGPGPANDAVVEKFDPLVSPPLEPTPPMRNESAMAVQTQHRLSVTNLAAHNREMWTCSICTFAENSLESPVCQVCGAIPPEAPPSPEPNADETWRALGGGPPRGKPMGKAQRRYSREVDFIGGQDLQFPEAQPPPRKPPSEPTSPRLMVGRGRGATLESEYAEALPPKDGARKRAQSERDAPNRAISPRAAANQGKGGLFSKMKNKLLGRDQDGPVPELMKNDSLATPSDLNDDAKEKPFSIATISPEKRQKLARKLEKFDTKKELLNYLEQTIVKVRDKLQKHVTCLLQYKKQLEKTKAEFEADATKWSEYCIRPLEKKADAYFSNRILFYTTCHDVEKMYADCFSEKLKKLKHAKAKIDRNKRHYSIEDMRKSIETSFDIAWRIRISDSVPEKQELLRDLRQIIDAEKEEYRLLKATYDVEISMEVRTKRVRAFLDKSLRQVSERRRGARKRAMRQQRRVNGDDDLDSVSQLSEISNSESDLMSSQMDDGNDDDFYYHEYDVDRQDTYNCFLLDRRVREGRIVHKWLLRQESQLDETTLESASEFLRSLTATFCNSYGLDEIEAEKDRYYDCVQLYLYRCMFVHVRFATLVSRILHDMTEISLNDEAFVSKTLWMRTLKQDQLGIEEQFRMEHTEVDMMSILNAVENNEDAGSAVASIPKRRKPSSLALVAGSDMPYAAAINVFGDIRKAVNPHEVLRILLSAVKSINYTASEYARMKGATDFVITGDSLFPIVVYCVVQCGLEEPHKHILLLETMLPKQSTFGAGAFALSVIKAAVSYILQANPADFGLPAEIEA